MQYNNICYSLEGDDIPDFLDLWDEYVAEHGDIPIEKKHKRNDKPPQIEDDKTKEGKSKKHIFLIAIYIFLIVIELFFYVPYHEIQVSVSEQNVPHTVVTGSGYTTMHEISNDTASVPYVGETRVGKRVNTHQLIINVSITTIIATAIYFLPRRKE